MSDKFYRRYIIEEFVVTNLLRHYARRNAANRRPRMVVVANDYIGHWITVAGGYEHSLLAPAMDFIAEHGFAAGKSCLDIGSNIGNHSMFFRQHFQKVLSVEANPKVFTLLEINTSNHANIECRNLAVGSQKGHAVLHLDDSINEGTGYVSPTIGEVQPGSGTIVEMDTLDNITASLDAAIGLIKIDVEGMEQAVLEGAKQTIARNRPAIFFEYHRAFQKERDTIELLRSEHGYSQFYYVAPRFDLQRYGNALANIGHVILNFLTNSRFVVKKVPVPATRSYEFIIALP